MRDLEPLAYLAGAVLCLWAGWSLTEWLIAAIGG